MKLEIHGKADAMRRGAEAEGVALALVVVVLHPVEAALADDLERDAGGQGGAAQRRSDGSDRHDDHPAFGFVLVVEIDIVIGGLMGAGRGDEGRAAHQAGDADTGAGDAADEELPTDRVLLAGADDGLREDVFADGVDQFAVGKRPAASVDEGGAIPVDPAGNILGADRLREAQESGHKAAENQCFFHESSVLYYTKVVILAGKSNGLTVFEAGLIFVRRNPRKHFKP